MDSTFTKSQLELSRNVHDLSSTSILREQVKKGDDAAIEETAKQFEAIFVKMLLKSMRDAQDTLSDEDSPFNSQQVKFYRDMHDQQLASDLSSGGGMGLAELIVQQLKHNNVDRDDSVAKTDGDLSSINRLRVATRQTAENIAFGLQNEHKQASFESPQEFIEKLYPYAVTAAEKLGIEPKALLAQAALETGWGQYLIHNNSGNNSHNLFGIKADARWQGDKTVVNTLEYVNQIPTPQKAAFRNYGDFESSLNDYVEFIQTNPRYEQAIEKTNDPQSYFDALQEAGYATDPKYAEKVMSVYNGELMKGLLP